ncbi:hypothetical protein Amsp01_001860 [Amycolatopsis sp. NBRC 101858]|nr:hypothetical protein Amsp01_001860 [Amycolatopsis sp. NBRC 101858]
MPATQLRPAFPGRFRAAGGVLLEEISWEGRSVVKYRDGGRGKETS